MTVSTQITNRPITNGILVTDLPVGAVFEVTTVNRIYTVENRGEGRMLISGHPKYCPEPVLVDQFGSASICTLPVIGPGLCLAYRHPRHGRIRTSRVESIREIQPDPAGYPA